MLKMDDACRLQSKRGGRVQLHTLLQPETEYSNGDKGEALYASELALSLEKLNFTVRCMLHALSSGMKYVRLALTGCFDTCGGHRLVVQAHTKRAMPCR